jgi:hypothetical protein
LEVVVAHYSSPDPEKLEKTGKTFNMRK